MSAFTHHLEIAQAALNAARDAAALRKSIQHEETKKHFFKLLNQLDVLLSEHPTLRDVDSVEEFIEAAKHANSMGQKYDTTTLKNWLNA